MYNGPQGAVRGTRITPEPQHTLRTFYRVAFTVAVLLFLYGTLFPFHFDFSPRTVIRAWRSAQMLPYWDTEHGRSSGIPDIVSNILLTMPLGGFGVLWRSQQNRKARVWVWGLVGCGLGLLVEGLQLGIPSRFPNVTDAINNAAGALLGAVMARPLGPGLRAMVAGTWTDRDRTNALLLVGLLTVGLLGPFDVTLDVASFKAHLRTLWHNPWETGQPVGDEWVQMAEFAIWGALAGTLLRHRKFPFGLRCVTGSLTVLTLPVAFELAQLFFESHTASVRDMAMGCLGVSAGLACRLSIPSLARPLTGLSVLALGLLAAGLSPYHFVPWAQHASFHWVPFEEYYTHLSIGAFYDAVIGCLHFALLAVLLRASWLSSRWRVVLLTVLVAAVIEYAQMFVPGRSAGITDVLMACLGAWAGDHLWTGMQHAPWPPAEALAATPEPEEQ